ncbi:porin [Ciceribacter sp. L1K23]|uniref:porin n=1 Tax=unclassified Ciceribacter TaxID=2628820 RepID=UPI001ABE8B21|nr:MULTISPECIES: porin [unclassified Ciceribacter]MBO3759603.1 porin [Ciceribacter sp. L1K22]MBR0556240.1 porin [Ciceribacter sp. L1K23]
MNIKSLLIGSAAALAVVSGAQAADAIVAAEPEPMEYVRVCDAFGTGYFYIPGTETCLKIGGYVRTQIDFRGENDFLDSGYRTNSRAYLEFDAKSDSELGTVGAYVALEADSRSNGTNAFIDTAVITVGGLEVGYFYNFWDEGLNGETDMFDGGPLSSVGAAGVLPGGDYVGGNTLNDTIRYTYSSDAFLVAAAVSNFDSGTGWKTNEGDDVGVEGKIGATFGGVNLSINGGYDFGFEDGAVRAMLTAELGPGTLGVAGVWSSGASRYWDFSEWSIAASYAIKATERLTITPGAQYWDNIVYDADGDYFGPSAWRAGLTFDYKLAEGLTTKASIQYTDVDDADSQWDGFLRLQRSF